MNKKIYLPDRASIGFFDKPASPDFWDSHWGPNRLMLSVTHRESNFFSDLVGSYLKPENGPVLEGGCGLGHNVYTLKMNGYQAVGIDFAQETIARIHAVVPDLDVRCGDVRSLPFCNDYFA